MGCQFTLLKESLPNFRQGFSGFRLAFERYQTVIKIFPQFTILFQVDNNGNVFLVVIDHKINTLHELSS
jgi:hypothetical protein